MSQRLHELLDKALTVPGVLQLRMKRFDAAFSKGEYGGFCRGTYRTYGEAAEAAPPTLPLGYDNKNAAAMYRDRINRVWPSDYASMLWLEKIFRAGATKVLDLGGHVGVSYYAYQKYIAYPPELAWQVVDVPAVAAAGREIALERDTLRCLSFVDDFGAAADAELLFTSGCLQYLEQTLADMLAPLKRRPHWVLVNLLPLHDSHEYWTVQSIGQAMCPYRIQRKSTFLADLERLGYEVVDSWDNAEKRCEVAFSPENTVEGYFGAVLRLKQAISH